MVLRRFCTLCGAAVGGEIEICTACWRSLPALGPSCPRCALPLAVNLDCGQCQSTTPPYSRCIAPFLYSYPIDLLLKAAKFSGRLHYLKVLGQIMAASIGPRLETRPECLIPVPLHSRRLFARGYNQALELARPVSERLAIPLLPNACIRVRHTDPQARLPASVRRIHLLDAFATMGRLPYRHIAILDDVVTTGSTAAALSTILLAAGTAKVEVWALARAI